ncbi:helix-turn-helix transcriptional regulator [Candidatus Mcinerneyibacteriota bacterium]|nr:helix-turn-helix transcriptional regulator [Candidatus Mcinerneyibacteriota bacterium]
MDNAVRELRREKNWTQEELARKVLVSRQTIISLEQGRYDPSIQLAFRLSRIFGKTIEEIFFYREEED